MSVELRSKSVPDCIGLRVTKFKDSEHEERSSL